MSEKDMQEKLRRMEDHCKQCLALLDEIKAIASQKTDDVALDVETDDFAPERAGSDPRVLDVGPLVPGEVINLGTITLHVVAGGEEGTIAVRPPAYPDVIHVSPGEAGINASDPSGLRVRS